MSSTESPRRICSGFASRKLWITGLAFCGLFFGVFFGYCPLRQTLSRASLPDRPPFAQEYQRRDCSVIWARLNDAVLNDETLFVFDEERDIACIYHADLQESQTTPNSLTVWAEPEGNKYRFLLSESPHEIQSPQELATVKLQPGQACVIRADRSIEVRLLNKGAMSRWDHRQSPAFRSNFEDAVAGLTLQPEP